MGFTFLFICVLESPFELRCRSPIVLNTFLIMKKVEFVKYDAPLVEVIEVEVEKGFATSSEGDGGATGEGMGGLG